MTTTATTTEASERTFLRMGAACAVAGGALGLVLNALHPRSSDIGDIDAELRLIEANGRWLAVHVGLLVAVLLVLAGLVALVRSLESGPAAPWARLALYGGLVSLPVALVSVGLDGIAMKAIADDWAAAGSGAPDVLRVAQAVGNVNIAVFDVFILVLFGLTPVLTGLAFARSSFYPRWMAPASIAAGVLGLVTGLVQAFTGLEPLTVNVLFPLASLAFTTVVVVAGIVLWSRADEVV